MRKTETLVVCWKFDSWLRGERSTPVGFSRGDCLEAIRDLPADATLVCTCPATVHCHGLWIMHWWHELNQVAPGDLSALPRRPPRPLVQGELF